MTRAFKLVVLFCCRALGGFWLARQVTKKRLRILCYHGFELIDEASFRSKLFIRGVTFEHRLATIRRMGLRVLPLGEAVERLYRGDLPPHSVVITVDDGFHSVAAVGLPRLHQYGYPATVYLTTYHVRHATPVFSLVVQYMFWKTAATQIDLKGLCGDNDGWFDLRLPEQRNRAMNRCVEFGRALESEPLRRDLCAALGQQLAVPYQSICRSKILTLMDEADVRSLARAGIDVELHTHRHSFPTDDKALALREIADNRAALQLLSDGAKRHFCYPSGVWDARQWAWLDEAGVLSSTTCLPGLNDRSTPRHALRRFLDGQNIHRLEFEAAMSGFSELLDVVRGRIRAFGAPALSPEPSKTTEG